MKFWLVGAGYWGSKVKETLENISGVTEVAVIDIKNGQTIDDIDSVDPVILATPLWQHYEQAKTLLQRGHDVYVEKPMAETLEQCKELKSLLKGDQVLMVGHIFLYNPLCTMLKEFIEWGRLGDNIHVESRRLNWGIRQTQTTPLLSLAPHDVSIINYLTDRVAQPTWASSQNLSNNSVPDMIEFGGYNFNCKVSWWWPKRERIVTVVGDRAQAVWDEDAKTLTIYDGHMEDRYPVKELTGTVYGGDELADHKSPLEIELNHFGACCLRRHQPTTGIDNAIEVATVLDQVDKLLQNNS